uniref:Gag-Pol polyprotein n=1 Tax=Tanacetum cinerariifolium TaxID=118510 RepID=A0A699JFJ5_TANCI|nr:hypothetical protein [Tanacetum cinerariifolium]
MESIKKSIDERAQHKRLYDRRVSKRLMQTQENIGQVNDQVPLVKVDNNTTPDLTNMCHRGGEIDQDAEHYQQPSNQTLQLGVGFLLLPFEQSATEFEDKQHPFSLMISSNPRNRQIAQPGMNMGQDRQMQMVEGNGGNQNQVIQNAVQNPRIQNVGNQNGLIVVSGNTNQNPNGNGNLVAARAEGNATGIMTILLGLPEDIYAAVDCCETAQEIWLRVHQMTKGSYIGIQEKKAKLFNEWERFTSSDGESIESYYHHFLKLMNDLKRNKHFQKRLTAILSF